MNNFSSLRVRLVGTVFLAITPALTVLYFTKLPWTGFIVGVFALVAAWFGGERFVLRQVRILLATTKRLAEGDFTIRTGLAKEKGEIGQLARTFDSLAENLEQRVKEREAAEHNLMNRALQQTVVAALGQFALTSNDFSTLLQQTVLLVSQTLEIEFCEVLGLAPDKKSLSQQTGIGWKDGYAEKTISMEEGTQARFTVASGEPIIITDLRAEKRFEVQPSLKDHGVLNGVSVSIATREYTFGTFGIYSARPRVFSGDDIQFLLAVATVLALAVDRQRSEAALQNLANFAKLNPNPAMELNAEARVTYSNDAAQQLALLTQQKNPASLLPTSVQEIVKICLATGQNRLRVETQVHGRTLSWSFHPVTASSVVHCYVEDSTERLNLEAQLRQSQKMESVGQLAAGVAHDFNNMLSVIQGHASMLMAKPSLAKEILDSVQAVYFAAERAASLTRQLLMFSRKNVMQTKLLDLREVIGSMSKMLRRLLGETVILEFNRPPELQLVLADAGMMEQVIMNLAVNARDAMPKGGKLTISLSAMEIKPDQGLTHPEVRPGSFICLRVTDTGSGMDAATMKHIFEPFFTTKEAGKGTGLGLATVYGIVKQHEGWVEVASEVGVGTTFNVLLPATDEVAKAIRKTEVSSTQVSRGTETVLVVEDEAVLRELAQVILEDCGYQIFQAASGVEALEVWRQHGNSIDLLMTDMVMPEGLSGIELSKKLREMKPELKVMFSSGYNVDEMDTDFMKKGGASFLQKPYTRFTLANAVRECLDRKTA